MAPRFSPPSLALALVWLAAAALLPRPACAYQDEGLIVFWAADGIHEIEMNASLAGGAVPPRIVLKQPRGDAAGVRWPPPVGGLAVDTNSKTVLWTSNAGKAGVFMAELDGSSKTASALVDAGAGPAADTFLGIDVDATKAVAHYAVYEPAGPAIRLMSVAFEEDAAGGGWRAKGPPESGASLRVSSMQGGGGGVVFKDGTLYLTAAKAGAGGGAAVPGVYKAKASGGSTPKALASCAMYGAWKGSIGYAVVQTDNSLQFVDATESSASSRKSVLLKVPADHASILEKPPFAVPVSVHTGVDAAGDARKVALQPSISATASVDDVLFLRGSPPTDIYEVDLKVPRSQAFRPIHKALSDELGEHGLGPIRWAKRVVLDSLAPETEAPPGTPTDAPPTDEPAAAATPAPPGAATATAVAEPTKTAAAGAATATAAAAGATETAAVAAAAATATLVDDATPVPDVDNATTAAPNAGGTPVPEAVCTAERLRPGCVEHEGCEFVSNHELALLSLPLAPPDPALPSSVLNGNCVVFGSMCDELRSEAECKVLTSCFWNPGTTTCLVSSYCSRRVTTTLCAEDTYQCRWDAGVGIGCTVDLHVPVSGDESRQSLLMVALIAMGGMCCLLICLAILATRVKQYAGSGERKKWYQEARIESALQDAGYEPVVGEEGQITVYEIEDEEKERERVQREEAKAQEYQRGLDRMLFDAPDVVTLNKKDVCDSESEEDDLSQDGSCDTDVVLGTTGTAARAVENVGDRGGGGKGAGGADEFFLELGGERTETEEKLVKQLEKARRDMARTQERHGREDRAAAGLTAAAAAAALGGGGADVGGSASVVDAGSFAGSKRGSRGVHTSFGPSFGNTTLGFSLDAPPPASPPAATAATPAASPADGDAAGDTAPLPPTRQQGTDGSVPPSPATSPHRRKLAGTTDSRVASWAQETNAAQAAAAAAAAAGPTTSSTNPLRAASSEEAEAEEAAAAAAGAKSPQRRNALQDSVSSSSPSPSKQSPKQGRRQSSSSSAQLQRPGSPESGVGGRSPSWAYNLSRHRSAKLCREICPSLPHGVVEVSPNQSAIHGLTSSKHF